MPDPLDFKRPPDGPLPYPKKLHAAVIARKDDEGEGQTNVYTRYEQIPGGWRCYLHMPALDSVAREYGREPGDPLLYGEAPTKEQARDIAVTYLEEQRQKALHLSGRLRAEEALRRTMKRA